MRIKAGSLIVAASVLVALGSPARAANVTAPLGRVPISVANLGVREVTLVGFLAFYGVEKTAALLMSMILFSALVLMAIIGAIYQISWALRSKKSVPPQ